MGEQTGTHAKKIKQDHQLMPHNRINSKWIKYLNISHDTIKTLAENIGSKISDSHVAIFLPIYVLGQGNKGNKRDYIKLKSFCTTKEIIIRMKRELPVWENIFANDTSDNGLISKIYKECIQLNTTMSNNPIKKWANDLNRHFSKEDIQMANRHMKKMFNITNHQSDSNHIKKDIETTKRKSGMNYTISEMNIYRELATC